MHASRHADPSVDPRRWRKWASFRVTLPGHAACVMQWHGFPTGSLTPGHDARPPTRSVSTTAPAHRPRLEAEAVAGMPLGWTRRRGGHAVDAVHAVAVPDGSG